MKVQENLFFSRSEQINKGKNRQLPKIYRKQNQTQENEKVNKMLQINNFDIENFTNVSQSYEFQKFNNNTKLNKSRDYSYNKYYQDQQPKCYSNRYSQNTNINYWAKIVFHQSRQNADKIFSHILSEKSQIL